METFQARLDELAGQALRSGMSFRTVKSFYDGMLDNFEDDEDRADEELMVLEHNITDLVAMLAAMEVIENYHSQAEAWTTYGTTYGYKEAA
jgi:hypothetical protein